MVDWVLIGLVVIAIAWIVQLVFSWKSNKIQPAFIVLYMLGVLIMVVSGYFAKLPVSPYEIFTLLAALVVLIRTLTLKNKRKS
ncbi:MAG: hypothetical protein WCK90_01315 [archaeon]